MEDPLNPWPGMCGTGRGEDTYTSGFELPFTTKPTQWDNEFFQNLLDYEWSVMVGPGGHYQWEPVVASGEEPPAAISANGSHSQTIGLLTSDVALIHDDEYRSTDDLATYFRFKDDIVQEQRWPCNIFPFQRCHHCAL